MSGALLQESTVHATSSEGGEVELQKGVGLRALSGVGWLGMFLVVYVVGTRGFLERLYEGRVLSVRCIGR